jgi:hypothetical protein
MVICFVVMNIACKVGSWQLNVCIIDGTIPESWVVHYGSVFKYITDVPHMSFSVEYSPPKCEYQGLGTDVMNSINIIPVALPMITVFTHKQSREELVRKRSAVYVSYETDTLKGGLIFKSRIKIGPYIWEPFPSISYSITYELMFKTDVTVSYIGSAYTYEDSKQTSLMRQPKLQMLSTVL